MKSLFTAFGLVALALHSLPAQEEDFAEEEFTDEAVEEVVQPARPAASVLDEKVIPEAYPETRYQNTWSANPFLRKTVVTAGPKVDWSQDWALSSMYKSPSGKITVSLQNKQTGEFKRVSSDDGPNSEFRLVKAQFDRSLSKASAEIEKGNETATLTYDDNLTSRPVTVNNTFKQPAAAPGNNVNPNVPMGQPGQPVNVTQPSSGRPVVPGAVPGMPGNPAMMPGNNSPQSPARPPSISRRRNLIPVPPPPAQNQ